MNAQRQRDEEWARKEAQWNAESRRLRLDFVDLMRRRGIRTNPLFIEGKATRTSGFLGRNTNVVRTYQYIGEMWHLRHDEWSLQICITTEAEMWRFEAPAGGRRQSDQLDERAAAHDRAGHQIAVRYDRFLFENNPKVVADELVAAAKRLTG